MKNFMKVMFALILVFSGFYSVAGGEVEAASKTTKVSNKTMYVTANSLNVRKTNSEKAKIVTKVKKGTAVIVTKSKNNWSNVKVNKKSGWVSSKYLSNTKKVKSTKKETIKFKTIKQNDNTLAKGTTKVAKKGQNGIKTITYETTYKNGKASKKKQVSSKVTKKAVNQIVKVGTKVVKPYQTKVNAVKVLNDKNHFYDAGRQERWVSVKRDRLFLTAYVGKSGVSQLSFQTGVYVNLLTSKAEFIELFGEKDGTRAYNEAQAGLADMNTATLRGTEAIFGSGTSESKTLQHEIIKMIKKERVQKVTKTIGGHNIVLHQTSPTALSVYPK